ncbi:hypothetical protein ACLOJK_012522 [Asimina triloba]
MNAWLTRLGIFLSLALKISKTPASLSPLLLFNFLALLFLISSAFSSLLPPPPPPPALPRMGKASKAKKGGNVGSGKITPMQVAFIVDRYLSDNNYRDTLSAFRREASNLISPAKIREAPKSLLSLGAMLDEYICLKEQKVFLDQEKFRVERLLQGMQDVMNAYNSARSIVPLPTSTPTPASQNGLGNGFYRGYPVFNTPAANSFPMFPSCASDPASFSTPVADLPSSNKRKGSRLVPDATPTTKKPCSEPPIKVLGSRSDDTLTQGANTGSDCGTAQHLPVVPSTSNGRPPKGTSVQVPSVAKSLFRQAPQSQSDSSWPKTPPQELHAQADESISPPESSSVSTNTLKQKSNTPQRIASTDCHVITTERVVVSPFKYTGCYTMDRSLRVSSSPLKSTPKRFGRRDHIKGRLDFDDSTALTCVENTVPEQICTTSSDEMGGLFDMDIPNFDVFGSDFSFSELLVDFDFENQGMGLPSHQVMDAPIDLTEGSGHDSGNGGSTGNQMSSEPPMSSITTIISEKDINRQAEYRNNRNDEAAIGYR